MRRRFPGLAESAAAAAVPDGAYLVSVEHARFGKRSRKSWYQLRFRIIEPVACAGRAVNARLYCTPASFWKLLWFLQEFGYDRELLQRSEIDDHALTGLRGVVRISQKTPHERGFAGLDTFESERRWPELGKGGFMIYSYTQLTQFLQCGRKYRYRYRDGWREREDRAVMHFGRAFEAGLTAYFSKQDPTAALFDAWSPARDLRLEYTRGDTWERMYRQGTRLLEQFAQQDRIRIADPARNLQVRLERVLPGGNTFVSYLDALGDFDGQYGVLEWKTSMSAYPVEPSGILRLDPQLICYSWMTGIADVALVAFLRKRLPEIQYLQTRITEEQRLEFGQLVASTIGRIQQDEFHRHSGIRFPQEACVRCPYTGLCLDQPDLVTQHLSRKPGAEAWDWVHALEV